MNPEFTVLCDWEDFLYPETVCEGFCFIFVCKCDTTLLLLSRGHNI